jgi:hypothetical protein
MVLVATLFMAPLASATPRCPSGTQPQRQDIGDATIVDVCVDAQQLLHGHAETRKAGVLISEDEWDHGTKVGTWKEWYGPNRPRSVTLYVKGQRQGAYSEFGPNGSQRVWGWFENDHEQGSWLLANDKGGGDAIGFVVFDDGVDVTTKMDDPPKNCTEWKKRTIAFRSGVLVTFALLAAKQLPDRDRKAITDWPQFGLCLRQRAAAAVNDVDVTCKQDNAPLAVIGTRANAALALQCVPRR